MMLLEKLPSETVTEYILKAEKSATALKNAGEQLSDSMLIATLLKGLPEEYTPFSVVVTQSEEADFSKFKAKLRSFEETERARTERSGSSVNYANHKRNQQQGNGGGGFNKNRNKGGGSGGSCYCCGDTGHKSDNCFAKKSGKLWCKVCKNKSHNDKACRKQQSKGQPSM